MPDGQYPRPTFRDLDLDGIGPLSVSFVLVAQGGAPFGYATLDGSGRVPSSQMSGASKLLGTWNASTNTPTLGDSGAGGVQGDYYIVATPGSTSIDGINSWALNDWIVRGTSAWTKQPNSGLPTSALTAADGSQIQGGTALVPDLVEWSRDSAGTIFEATDKTSTKLLQALRVFGPTTLVTYTADSGAVTTQTVGTLALTSGDLVQNAGASITDDLAFRIRGDNDQIIFGLGQDGSTIMGNAIVTGTLTAPGIGASSAPADALDITDYGAVGDGADDVFLGTWTAGAATLSIIKYSGAVTWSGNVLTLTNLSTSTGPGFDPGVVGMSVCVVATDGSGVNQTVQITGPVLTSSGGWQENVVTVSATPGPTVTTATVTWPAFTAGDVGKTIRVESGMTSTVRQALNSGFFPWVGTIATVVDGHSVTVTGPLVPTFGSTAAGLPTRVSWGTDNTGAYISAQADLLSTGARVLYHPRADGRGKTVYCAFTLAQRGGADDYYALISRAPAIAYQQAMWLGDPSVVGVLTDVSGRLMPKVIVPIRSPAGRVPTRDVIGRLHMPRVQANSTIHVVEVGDSLAKYNPTNQSDAWFPTNVFEWLLQLQNPAKTFTFTNIANIGVGWSEMVDPTSGTPSWVIAGTDLYYMSSSGNNDGWRGHPLKVMSGINLGLGSGNDGGGRPPNILLTTGALKGDIPSNLGGGAAAAVHDQHLFMETLLRSMAKRQGYGLVDMSWQSQQILHGADNYHRELQKLPPINGFALAAATPFRMLTDCHSWSMYMTLTASGGQVWPALGVMTVQLSPMPGNVAIFDSDGGFFRYEVRLWGRSVATTVSTSGSTLTTAVGTSLPSGTLTWVAGQNKLIHGGGGMTGRAGQCLFLPGLDISGQHERTYIAQVIDDQTIVVDDFWWGASPGFETTETFSGTVVPVAGGQTFIAADAAAQSDVVITWGAGNRYNGKITGFTDANTATVSPAPPSLTGQAAQMWIGRVSVPVTTTTQSTTGTSVSVDVSYNKDVLSVCYQSITAHAFKGVVERFGTRYCPTVSVTGAVTCNFTNLYADRDVYWMPAGAIADIWSYNDANYSSGGGGGHDTSILAERITRPVYEALDFCTS